MKAWPIFAIVLLQTFLCAAHWFMYNTWIDFWWPMSPKAVLALRIGLAVLSVIFVAASLLSFRYSNPFVKSFYLLAALWMGLANFLFFGAWIAWLVDLLLRLSVSNATRIADRPYIAGALLVAGIATSVYGLVNARAVRLRRMIVQLPKLPENWRGRQALMVSDLHLGHINGVKFAARCGNGARVEPGDDASPRRYV